MATQTTTNDLTHCACDCRERTAIERDHAPNAMTIACATCRRCWLLVVYPDFAAGVALRDFHLKRGDGPLQRPLSDLRMAERLVECLDLDVWPTPAVVVDYGIETGGHYGALQHAVRSGLSAYALDRVMGDGPAITRLVRAVPGQPYPEVEFRTAYDAMDWPEDDEADGS